MHYNGNDAKKGAHLPGKKKSGGLKKDWMNGIDFRQQSINKRGFKKYLSSNWLTAPCSIDYKKLVTESKWDGLTGLCYQYAKP
ncbi:MAG: hypothetical protein U5K51_03740 [Flavobacteriaceae bacterium]|nr:hypothetical protein [Flavobacteriaceae bacterium]